MKRKIFLTLLTVFAIATEAQVTMSPLFTDNMVLQQKTDAPMWGKSAPGRKISVATSWNKRKYETTADSNGMWRLSVSTPKAGGPYEITVSDGHPLTLHNVMIGEVWLCSGQSNMEMPVNGWSQVVNHETEVSNAGHDNIRLLQVDKVLSMRPETSFTAAGGGWQVCSPQTIEPFSAVAYFFGRDIAEYRDVPVGLIHSSWGGTPAEAWTSSGSLAAMPSMADEVKRMAAMPADKAQLQQFYNNEMSRWMKRLDETLSAKDNNVHLYGTESYDDSQWSDVQVPGNITGKEFDSFDGIIWYRKTVDIPESMAGKPLTLRLGRIDDHDLTFFNGVEVGHKYGHTLTREYDIPAELVGQGRAVILIRDMDTGGLAGITGYGDRQCELRTADGQTITLNGTWKAKAGTAMKELPAQPLNPLGNPHNVSVLYNAMINPLVGYAMKGAIWYQGENNASRAWEYRDLLPVMIEDWRAQWNSQFPFYIVQLANFRQRQPQPGESDWAELREAQHMTAKTLDNCGMACIIDIGDANDIHPRNKQDVGHRLALIARHNTYGEKKTLYAGPEYRSCKVENGKMRIFFDHTDGGLATSDGGQLKGFAIAGPDHKFHWADARIDGNTVVVASPEVKLPVAVRYAWADNPDCNLTNGTRLPAVPFRTDDWPGRTYGNTTH